LGNPELNVTSTKIKKNKQRDEKEEEQNHCQSPDESNGDNNRKRKKQKWIPLNIDVIFECGTVRSRYEHRERNSEPRKMNYVT